VATYQAEHSEPKTTTPEKDFIFSSKRSFQEPNFAKKRKSLASTTNLRSMTGLNRQTPRNRIIEHEDRRTKREETSLAK
jgi:hypothetical protein